MFKKDTLKDPNIRGVLVKAKENLTYILLAVLIILLLVLHFQKLCLIERLGQIQNRTELEVKSLKALVGKQLNEIDDQLKTIFEDAQKNLSLNEEQSKTLAIIPEDNAFFKKWAASSHLETLNSIEDLKTRIDEAKRTINDVKIELNNISIINEPKTNNPKETVQSISI